MEELVTYGDARRTWNRAFIEYMGSIVDHPNYAGMPCTRDDDGKIDWTIPSNRPRGSKNWDGNVRRREWWRQKADEMGIPQEGHWLSRTAKAIHPFGRKPCQTCGRILELAYVYPTVTTIAQLNRFLPPAEVLDHSLLLSIDEVVDHMFTVLQSEAPDVLREVFPNAGSHRDPGSAAQSIREEYCARESRKFSPGAMANPPDRLDGFHTYNLCCRSKQDTGRASENLRSYGVDRRAYEQWCEGDWAAADLLMSQVGEGPCLDCGTVGPLTADHVGPISLGFTHSPHFRPLCGSCNSAKNNRMSLADVDNLLEREAAGEKVVSWHAQGLWDGCKEQIGSDADALLLSKLLRINQHHYLTALYVAVERDIPDVLLGFLHPEYAYRKVEFEGLDTVSLTFAAIKYRERHDTYARMRGSRMVRIAFDSLIAYVAKPHRNIQGVSPELVRPEFDRYLRVIDEAAGERSPFRAALVDVIRSPEGASVRDEHLARVFTAVDPHRFTDVLREPLADLMLAYARVLQARFERGESVSWDDLED